MTVAASLSAPSTVKAGQSITYTVSVRNDSPYALNGTQVRFHLPKGLAFSGTLSDVGAEPDSVGLPTAGARPGLRPLGVPSSG